MTILDLTRPVASLLEALGDAGSPTRLAAAMVALRGKGTVAGIRSAITTARAVTLDAVSVRLLAEIAAAAGKRLEIRLVDGAEP